MELSPKALVILAVALAVPAAASPRPPARTSWNALDGEPSRTELFDAFVVPARQAADADSGTGPIDLAIPKKFYFPTDARTDVIMSRPRQGALFGIDISHYTKPDLNYALLKLQDVRFVYVKATQGTQFKDARFGTFWAALHALPPPQTVSVGAYHFLEAGVDATAQAERFVSYLDLHGGLQPGDMPPCVDFEWDRTATNPDRWTGVSADDAVQRVVDFVTYVEKRTGRQPLVYTAKSFLDGRGIKGPLLARITGYPLWVADYSVSRKAVEKPALPAGGKTVLWQFASDAQLTEGYTGALDANIYYGSEADFVRDFGLKP